MDPLIYVAALLFTGLLAGLATGLLGVGGGFIIAPVLFFLMEAGGTPPDIAIRTAFGTSLAIILPTALSGAHSHYRRKCVDSRIGITMGVLGACGSVAGVFTASASPAYVLRAFFGVLLILVSAQLLLSSRISPSGFGRNAAFPLGFLAGFLSGLLGIGGGVVLVPLLVMVAGFDVLEAVGTSSLVIAFTAASGTISYILAGPGGPFTVGYVNLLQFLLVIVMSVPSSRLGALIAHRVDVRYIRYIFIILLLFTGLRMLL
ncbi:MAG: sulfite exporter TauE/SafE family protein [Methanothermobacter thermautotrophicus]|nr:sulfite exporter TauE/SafE family protein [Methanothermobacter thermautotrophicus]